jgi:hypothetical protein
MSRTKRDNIFSDQVTFLIKRTLKRSSDQQKSADKRSTGESDYRRQQFWLLLTQTMGDLASTSTESLSFAQQHEGASALPCTATYGQ